MSSVLHSNADGSYTWKVTHEVNIQLDVHVKIAVNQSEAVGVVGPRDDMFSQQNLDDIKTIHNIGETKILKGEYKGSRIKFTDGVYSKVIKRETQLILNTRTAYTLWPSVGPSLRSSLNIVPNGVKWASDASNSLMIRADSRVHLHGLFQMFSDRDPKWFSDASELISDTSYF